MMGLLCYAERDNACAQQWWEKTIQLDGNAAAAANNLAWLYAEGRGNLDVALELAKGAKARFPEHPEVNDTLGWILLQEASSNAGAPVSAAKRGRGPQESPVSIPHRDDLRVGGRGQ